VTMGQLLSLPMLLLGIGLWIAAYSRPAPSGNFVPAQ
jgi:prolipoprotein diacylglyceryltransferase